MHLSQIGSQRFEIEISEACWILVVAAVVLVLCLACAIYIVCKSSIGCTCNWIMCNFQRPHLPEANSMVLTDSAGWNQSGPLGSKTSLRTGACNSSGNVTSSRQSNIYDTYGCFGSSNMTSTSRYQTANTCKSKNGAGYKSYV